MKSWEWAYIIGIAIAVAFVSELGMSFYQSASEVALGINLKEAMLKQVIFQQVEWFDQEENSVDALNSVFDDDATSLVGLTFDFYFIWVYVALLLALSIYGMSLFWGTTILVILFLVPIMWLPGLLRTRFEFTQVEAQKEQAIVAKILSNFKQLAGLGPSSKVQILETYDQQLGKLRAISRKQACIDALLLGFSLFTRFVYFIAVLWIIGLLARNISEEFNVGLVLFQAVIFFASYAEIEFTLQRVPTRLTSDDCAKRVFRIIDKPSLVDVRDRQPRTFVENASIEFRQVYFKYPNHEKSILSNFSLRIE